MKIIKNILIAIAVIIIIALLAALFIKKEYAVEREITINKPKQEVFDYLKLMKNQVYYNKWTMKDPGSVKEFRGTDGTPGFVVAWDSKDSDVGKGEQEIKNINEGNRINYEIRFEKPFEGIADIQFITEATSATQTKVKWTFAGKNKYPMNLMNLFIDGMLGKDMNASLNNLKAVLEK